MRMCVCTRVSAPRYQMWHMITDWLIMLMTHSEVCHMPFSSSSLILSLNIFGRSDHGTNSHSYSFHRSCQLYRTRAARAGVGRADDHLKQSPIFTSRLHPLSEAAMHSLLVRRTKRRPRQTREPGRVRQGDTTRQAVLALTWFASGTWCCQICVWPICTPPEGHRIGTSAEEIQPAPLLS